MIIRNAILATCFLLLGASAAAPQNNASICDQVESSVTNKAPSWKLARKSKSCHWVSYFQWTSGKSNIYVFLYPVASRKDAVDTFQLLASDDELVGEKTNSLGTGLRELGDDNRLWTTPTFGSRGVDLRKGNVVVRVSAPTMELALQFAAYITQGLPSG